MSQEAVFEHLGHAFKVANSSPTPSDIKAGHWVRICYDPYENKDDIVALVLSCRAFWRNNPYGDGRGLMDDHQLHLARNGDHADAFMQFFTDEHIELLERIDPHHGRPEEESPVMGRGKLDIVVCLDGTWNENETQNTNVHRILSFVDRDRAIANYYSGVGVGGMRLQNGLDGASGRGVFRTVRSAYTFVRANYKDGDRIFIFGFSRGAYAARHLAGMIARIGVNAHPEVGYKDYRQSVLRSGSGQGECNKGTDVHFLGLFDCVPGNQIFSVRNVNRQMNNPVLEPRIGNFAHAVSRDERRWSFKPLIMIESGQTLFAQRWFPGCHFDVGGDENQPLNDFALVWMLTQALACGLALSGGLDEPFDPTARPKPRIYWSTRMGLECRRDKLPDGELVESVITREELRKTISDLTRLREPEAPLELPR